MSGTQFPDWNLPNGSAVINTVDLPLVLAAGVLSINNATTAAVGVVQLNDSYPTVGHTDAATSYYVSQAIAAAVVSALRPVMSVIAFVNTNTPLTGVTTVVNSTGDTITLANGNEVCLSNQTTALENARYIFNSGNLTLASDCNTGSNQENTIFSETSTANLYAVISSIPVIVGTNVINFSLFTQGGINTAQGTANEILVNGTSGTPVYGNIILSTPQPIGIGSNVQFAALKLSGLTASQAVVTDGSKNLISMQYSSTNVSSTIVSRDSNGNSYFNNVSSATATFTSGTISLTVGTPRLILLTSSATGVTLPDATTLQNGTKFEINNNTSSTIVINKNGGTLLISVVSGAYCNVYLTDNTTSAGTWDYHFLIAANGIWGTAGLSTPGQVKCATFQMTTSPTNNYVLTSDSSGNGTWQPLSGIGVTSVVGTTNQVTVNTVSGVATISLPTSIVFNAGSISPNVQFDFHQSLGYGLYFEGTCSSVASSTNQVGIYNNATYNPPTGTAITYGFWSEPIIALASGHTLPTGACFTASMSSAGNAGTITNYIGFYYDGSATVNNITNMYGGYFKSPPSGTATANQALYADNISIGYPTLNLNGGNNAFINGRLIIGKTTDDGSNLIQVNGNSIYLGIVSAYTVYTSAFRLSTFTSVGDVIVCTSGSGDAAWSTPAAAGLITSVTGTTNQINASTTTGAVTLSLSSTLVTPGTLAINSMTTGSILFSGASGVVSQDNLNLFWDSTNHILDVSALNVGSSVSPTGTYYITQISGTVSPSISSFCIFSGLECTPTYATSSDSNHTTYYYGIGSTPTMQLASGTSTSGVVTAIYAQMRFSSSNAANITSVYNIYSEVSTVSGTGTVTNMYGGFFNAPGSGATHRQALYTANLSIGYLATDLSGTNNAIIAGNLGIKDTSPNAGISCITNAQIGFSSGTSAPTNGLAVAGQLSVGTNSPSSTRNVTISGGTGFCSSLDINATVTVQDGSHNMFGIEFYQTFAAVSDTSANFTTLLFNPSLLMASNATSYFGYSHTPLIATTSSNYVLTNYYGINLGVGTLSGGGSVTNAYNLFVNAPGFGSTVRQAIYTDNLSVGYTGTNLAGTNNIICNGSIGVGISPPNTRIHARGVNQTFTDYGILTVDINDSNNSSGMTFGFDTSHDWSWIYSRTTGINEKPIVVNNTIYLGHENNIKLGVNDLAPASTFSVVGNAQIGFSSGTSAPANSLAVQSQIIAGSSSSSVGAKLEIISSGVYGLYLGGSLTSVDGSNNQLGLYLSPIFKPTSGSTGSYNYLGPNYQVPSGQIITTGTGFLLTNYLADTSNLGTITTLYGLHYDGGSSLHAGASVGTHIGMQIDQPQAGTTKYAVAINGGLVVAGTTITTATTLTAANNIVKVNASAAVTVTMPSTVPGSSTLFWVCRIKDVSNAAATNNITISGNGHNIDFASTATIETNGGALEIFADGTQYWLA